MLSSIRVLTNDHPLLSPKFLLTRQGADEWFEKKFGDEIKALALIDHPGVVGALDAGRTQDGTPYLVMQYVDGLTLRALLREASIPVPRAARIIAQVGQALGAAHDRGIWHRDLKPENIMLQQLPSNEDHVRLIDFGVARIQQTNDPHTLGVTRVVGTVAYMAPEQLLGRCCAASDIYSMGIIVHELLTGTLPFDVRSPIEHYSRQLFEQWTRNDTFLNLPSGVQELIKKALAFDPGKRFSRPQELGDALAHALVSLPMPEARSSFQPRLLEVAMAPRIPIYKPAELVALIRRIESDGLQAILELDGDFSLTKEAIRSKSLQLEFPRDHLGHLQPLALLLRVDAPDFEPKTQTKTILVPTDRDSDAHTFLLSPQHLGELRLTLAVCLSDVHIASRILKTYSERSDRRSMPITSLVTIPFHVLVDLAPTRPTQGDRETTGRFATKPTPHYQHERLAIVLSAATPSAGHLERTGTFPKLATEAQPETSVQTALPTSPRPGVWRPVWKRSFAVAITSLVLVILAPLLLQKRGSVVERSPKHARKWKRAPNLNPVLSINDNGTTIFLEKDATVSGIALNAVDQVTVSQVLTTRHLITPPDLNTLIAKPTVLMGYKTILSHTLISPVGTVIESVLPTFRWSPDSTATAYTVAIFDEAFREVLVQRVSNTQVTASRPLRRGEVYSWQVSAHTKDRDIIASRPPSPEAKFKILAYKELTELAVLRHQYINSHLLLSIVYSRYGLLDNAEHELRLLLNANPDSAVVKTPAGRIDIEATTVNHRDPRAPDSGSWCSGGPAEGAPDRP